MQCGAPSVIKFAYKQQQVLLSTLNHGEIGVLFTDFAISSTGGSTQCRLLKRQKQAVSRRYDASFAKSNFTHVGFSQISVAEFDGLW